MARPFSVCKHFAHVNEQVVIEDMDLNVDKDGVVSVILDVRPYKRHQRRCPHCGKRCPGYDSISSSPRLWRALDCGLVLAYKGGQIDVSTGHAGALSLVEYAEGFINEVKEQIDAQAA